MGKTSEVESDGVSETIPNYSYVVEFLTHRRILHQAGLQFHCTACTPEIVGSFQQLVCDVESPSSVEGNSGERSFHLGNVPPESQDSYLVPGHYFA